MVGGAQRHGLAPERLSLRLKGLTMLAGSRLSTGGPPSRLVRAASIPHGRRLTGASATGRYLVTRARHTKLRDAAGNVSGDSVDGLEVNRSKSRTATRPSFACSKWQRYARWCPVRGAASVSTRMATRHGSAWPNPKGAPAR